MKTPMTDNPWIVRSKPHPDPSLRLFCFPHAGGSAAMFFAWPALLPEAVEVIALQLPGRGRRVREAPHTRMKPLVADIRDAVGPFLDRPYAVFGQSLGALIGFELACALAAGGYAPKHFFVSACSAPHLHAPDPQIHALPDAAFLSALQQMNGTPQEILEHEELMRQLLPAFRADFALSETYRYSEGALACPITAFGGHEDRLVPAANLAAWRQHTTAAFSQTMYPGGHFYLQGSQGVLLQRVSLDLGLD